MATYYVPDSDGCLMGKTTGAWARVRISTIEELDEDNKKIYVTAKMWVKTNVTYGTWTGSIRTRSTQSGTTTSSQVGDGKYHELFSNDFTFTIKDDGSYSYTIYGTLNAPSGTSMEGLSVSSSDLTRSFSREAQTKQIYYTELDKYQTFIPGEQFQLLTGKPDDNITQATYQCSITGGDGGTYSEISSTRQTIHTTGKKFIGWKTETGTNIYQPGQYVTFQYNTTFYAQWSDVDESTTFDWPYKSDFSHDSKSETFTITGDGNGGTNKASNATKTTPYDISSSLTSNLGYTYYYGDTDHLTKDEDGNTVYPTWTEGTPKYTNNTIGNLDSTSRDDATKIGYIISFEGLSSQVNQDLSCSYTFDGWYDSADGGNKYDDSASFTEATTVYAHWNETKKPNAVQLPDPTARPGYEFLGWMTSEGKILTGDDFADMLPTVEGEGITLTASWKAKGLVRICVGGEYKQALCYIYHEGQYHQAMPYVYTNGKYRLGG